MDINQYDFLRRRMLLIAHNFFKAKELLRNKSSLNDTNTRMLFAYIDSVERAFLLLEDEEKDFLSKEYFYDGEPFWWKTIYKEKDFKEFHNSVLTHFMEGFYAIIN